MYPRDEILRQLHQLNPFAGYNEPDNWQRVSTKALGETLKRYRAEDDSTTEKRSETLRQPKEEEGE